MKKTVLHAIPVMLTVAVLKMPTSPFRLLRALRYYRNWRWSAAAAEEEEEVLRED
jgi:hypothetical protein